jgi:hypothetical protein
MTHNIGERALTENINTNIARTGIREIDEVTYHFNQSVTAISAPSELTNNTNIYYQNIPWAYVTQHVPSAPIAYAIVETKESEGMINKRL